MTLRTCCRQLWHDDNHLTSVIFLFFTPPLLFLLTEWFYQPFGLIAGGPWSSFINILLIALVLTFFWLATKRLHLAVIITSLICLALALTNYYLLRFRATPLLPWDLFSARTALGVATSYDYRLDGAHSCLLFLIAVWMGAACRCRWQHHCSSTKKLAVLWSCWLLAAGAMLAILYNDTLLEKMYFERNLYNLTNTVAHDGLLASQLINLRQLFLRPPPGYSPQKAREILAQDAAPTATPATRPHLIAIMDEAFSDLGVYGDLGSTTDPLPHLHALQEASSSARTGLLHVGVLGGNTANTEWEFLTGGSLAFLPPGAVPYLQFSQKTAPSLPRHLRSLGYQTTAIHPYLAAGWRREKVYQKLGFQEFLAEPDFSGAARVHGFVSDEAAFDKIIEVFEAKNPGTPQFIWEVTMQNHSGYTDCAASLSHQVYSTLTTDSGVDCYLSLMAETDSALGRLLDYFSQVEEPVVIAFFGDHQPGNQILAPLRGALANQSPAVTTPDINYLTPYLIWTNFPSPARHQADTSSNYLGIDFLRAAGLPLSRHQELVAAARKDFPVLTSQVAISADAQVCRPAGVQAGASHALDDYRLVQYWWLAGK